MAEGTTDVHVGGLCCVLEIICRKEASSGVRERACTGGNKAGEESNTEAMDEKFEISSQKSDRRSDNEHRDVAINSGRLKSGDAVNPRMPIEAASKIKCRTMDKRTFSSTTVGELFDERSSLYECSGAVRLELSSENSWRSGEKTRCPAIVSRNRGDGGRSGGVKKEDEVISSSDILLIHFCN